MTKTKIMSMILATVSAAMLMCAAFSVQAYAYEQRDSIVTYGHGYNSAEYLVVHETANPGASASNHVSYWTDNPDYAVHYVMELDGSVVYHTVPDWALAWHVGNGNYATVGIELAHATNADDFATQWREAVAWCGDYLYSRGWGVDRMLSHDECRWIWGGTDHTDPTDYFAEYGHTWSEFETAVETYMRTGQADANEPVEPETPSAPSDGSVEYGFGGTYTCNVDALNVRDAIWGSVVAQYAFGETVVLDDWYAVDGGIVWGRYTSWSGATRYVAVGGWTGSPETNDYLIKGTVGHTSYGYSGGWKTVTADVLNVRNDVWGSVVAQYYAGESVYIDYVAYGSDGSAWGVYTSWSGATRYVSMDWLR